MTTIRQIADEIGVSKQAVFKKIKREPLSTSLQGLTATVDGRLMVEVDGEKLIKQAFSEIAPSTTDNQLTGAVDGLVDAPSTKNAEKTAEVDGVISVLQATIDTLQGQLEVKDRQNKGCALWVYPFFVRCFFSNILMPMRKSSHYNEKKYSLG